MLDTGADAAAVNEDHGLVGRTDAVRVGSDIGHALRRPPGSAAETGIDKRSVKRYDEHIGTVIRIVGTHFKACGFKLADHTRRAEYKKALCVGEVSLDIVDGRNGRGVDLLTGCLDAQTGELLDVIIERTGRVVGQKRVSDAVVSEFLQKALGPWEELRAKIDGAVHIEGDMAYAAAGFLKLGVAHGRHIFIKFHN